MLAIMMRHLMTCKQIVMPLGTSPSGNRCPKVLDRRRETTRGSGAGPRAREDRGQRTTPITRWQTRHHPAEWQRNRAENGLYNSESAIGGSVLVSTNGSILVSVKAPISSNLMTWP
jgi:hypothetical protein